MRRHNSFGLATILFLLLGGTAFAAEKSTATQLIELAKTNSPTLKNAIINTLDAKELKDGTAWIGRGPDFFFAIEATSKPALLIDGAPGPQMENLSGSDLWYASARIEPVGKLHSFYYVLNGTKDGKKFGGRLDLPAFGPLSYQQPGIPSGTLSLKLFTPAKSTMA